MISYAVEPSKTDIHKIDRTKSNILLIGSGTTTSKSKIILNPMTIGSAKTLYGEDSILAKTYEQVFGEPSQVGSTLAFDNWLAAIRKEFGNEAN